VFSEFGLKVSVFNLRTQRSVDISSPKFYHAGVATKGFSYRPKTGNLALLTRSGGKDVVSVHVKDSLDVMRSWCPDTIDAQGVCWSADGRWLVVWESPSQGHRICVYTADGHLFKCWNGPVHISDEDSDISLGAGIKLLDWSRDGALVAVGDYSRRVTILSAPSFTETTSLFHTTTVKPAESLQVRYIPPLMDLADSSRYGRSRSSPRRTVASHVSSLQQHKQYALQHQDRPLLQTQNQRSERILCPSTHPAPS